MTAKGQCPRAQRTQRKVQVLQNKLHQAAKKDLNRTFGILYDKILIWEVLWTSWIRVQRNKGAPGVDGRTIGAIKKDGEVKFIREIQAELLEKKYRPQPIRRVFIEKANGKLKGYCSRPIGVLSAGRGIADPFGMMHTIMSLILSTSVFASAKAVSPTISFRCGDKTVSDGELRDRGYWSFYLIESKRSRLSERHGVECAVEGLNCPASEQDRLRREAMESGARQTAYAQEDWQLRMKIAKESLELPPEKWDRTLDQNLDEVVEKLEREKALVKGLFREYIELIFRNAGFLARGVQIEDGLVDALARQLECAEVHGDRLFGMQVFMGLHGLTGVHVYGLHKPPRFIRADTDQR
ncbi:MAG TPA: hypothetical protein PKC28_08775 [Bdellovibrionales bacterium]|nr:hypothetical protein [Bdellovibrionales bacterium]